MYYPQSSKTLEAVKSSSSSLETGDFGKAARDWIQSRAAVVCAGLCALTMLTSCGVRNNSQVIEMDIQTEPQLEQRFDVEAAGQFGDSLAYRGVRGIYIIKDTKTGKEYVGVSGIGISEVGSHTRSNGKTSYTVQDER